jgi:hypothetical protein
MGELTEELLAVAIATADDAGLLGDAAAFHGVTDAQLKCGYEQLSRRPVRARA